MMIKSKRMSKGLTQEQLAKEMNVTRSTVAMWEKGVSTPRPAVLVRMAGFFACTVDELLQKGEAENGKSGVS